MGIEFESDGLSCHARKMHENTMLSTT
jgi:hypothetical protein